MDRKPGNSRGSDNSSKGANNVKEEALEKLRKMEWARNKQDTWHLSRPNLRNVDIQEQKKHNQDNYFDGTFGNQKRKGTRKVRETPAQPVVPQGFTISVSNGPPPVNAWTQKKGSSLFNKPEEDPDIEEDEMLKLALQESLRTAEEEKKRHLERLRLYRSEEASYSGQDLNEPNDDFPTKTDFVSPPKFNEHYGKQNDIHFIDPDSTKDPCITKQKTKLHYRSRQSSSSVEDIYDKEVYENIDPFVEKLSNKHQPLQQEKDDIFEPSRPSYATTNNQSTAHGETISKMKYSNPLSIPGKDGNPFTDLSANLKSTLKIKFGETEEIFESLQSEDHNNTPPMTAQNHQFDSSVYKQKEEAFLSQSLNDKTASLPKVSSAGPSETDILVHSFIRHEPPSSLAPNSGFQETERPAEIFSLNASQQYFSPNSSQEEQLLLNGFVSKTQAQSVSTDQSGQNSNSPSPLQNNSPYGSLGKHMVTNTTANMFMQPQNLSNLQGAINMQNNQEVAMKLQDTQLPSHLASHSMYPNYSAGFVPHPVHPGLPLSPGIPSYSPFCFPNSNIMMPSLPAQDLQNPVSQLNQAQALQMQQYMFQNSMMKYMQHCQQAQLAALSINRPESSESPEPEQSATFGQMQPQPQRFPVENRSQLMAQNMLLQQQQLLQFQSQQKINPQVLSNPEIPSIKQEDPVSYHQSNQGEPGLQRSAQSKEEIMLQYEQTKQALEQLRKQLETSEEPQAMPVSQQFMVPTRPAVVGNSYYPIPMQTLSQSQQPIIQQIASTGQLSPNQQNTSVAPEMFLNMSQNSSIHSSVPQTMGGRGRGRQM